MYISNKISQILLSLLFLVFLTIVSPISAHAALNLNDQSSNGHNLTNNDATEITTGLPFAQSTEAVNFDGSDDYLTTPNAADLSVNNTHQLTIELWVKPSSLSDNNTVIAKGTSGKWEYKLTVGKANGSIEYNVFSLDGNNRYTGTSVASVISTGTWYHIAFVIDDSGTFAATNAKVYVNGTEVSYATQLGDSTHTLANGTAPLEVGRYSPGSNYFNGEVDDLRVWNIARTSTQINGDMSKLLAGTDDGLVAYYPFETLPQPSWDFHDQSRNEHDLTSHGVTEYTTNFPFTGSTEAAGFSSSQYFATPNTSDLSVSNTHKLTIELWVKPTSLSDDNTVIAKGTSGEWEYKLTVGKANGSIEYNVFSLDGNNRYTGTSVGSIISAGSWYHIAFVIDDSGTFATTNAKVYVNGTEISYGTQLGGSSNVLANGTAPLEIGRYSPGSNYFNGEVDDVRVWNTARTSTQISNDYSSPALLSGTESGLVAYYPYMNRLQSKINYYTANVSNFGRSTTPFNSGIATQTNNTNGSVTMSINSTSSYADSGIVLYEGTLANLPNFTVNGTGDPYSLNIWIDTGGDGDFFAWDGSGNLTGLNGDTYALGPSSSSGTDAITGSTQFYLLSDSTNHTFSDLKEGNVSGINPSDKVAVWIGVNTTSGSTSATINSVSGL